jgi:hypothetical protein
MRRTGGGGARKALPKVFCLASWMLENTRRMNY